MGKISVEEAARIMGVTPKFLRMGLRLGRFPFGTAIQTPGGRWSYYINAERFRLYMAGEDMAEAGVLQEMREALQAVLDAFVWAQDAPPLKNPDGSRTGWQFVATRTLDRVRELLRRSGDPVPDRALARFLGEEAPS